MEAFVNRMIDEHIELNRRISKLETFIYGDAANKVTRADFANMCLQLKAMRNYEEALSARLINQNVVYEHGQYFEKIAEDVKIEKEKDDADK